MQQAVHAGAARRTPRAARRVLARDVLSRRHDLHAALLQRLDQLFEPLHRVLHKHAPHVRRARADGARRGGRVVHLVRRGALGLAREMARAPGLAEPAQPNAVASSAVGRRQSTRHRAASLRLPRGRERPSRATLSSWRPSQGRGKPRASGAALRGGG